MVIDNPTKKPVLELWTNLREKLMRIVKERKEACDTIYGLLYPPGLDGLEKMKKNLTENKKLLARYDDRLPGQMFSLEDQFEYNRLVYEVNSLKKEIPLQEFLKGLNSETERLLVKRFSSLEIKVNATKQDVAIANGKIDLLNEKFKRVKWVIEGPSYSTTNEKIERLKEMIEERQI